jgi:hypothetical protein
MRTHLLSAPLAAALVVLLAACGSSAEPVATAPIAGLPVIEVHRSPTCGCCEEYEDYLRAEGFTVEEVVREDIAELKDTLGVPPGYGSCHTALIDGYFVEGHVPADVILDLLETQPDVDGIALPGMPAGSPGMPGSKEGPWTIYSVTGGEPTELTSY